jgi:tetratricopeptide (TPR) repeat protein
MVRLADAYKSMGKDAEAEKLYLESIKIQGEDRYALMGLGNLYYKEREDDKALKYFEKLLSLDEHYVAVLTMVGNIYQRRSDYPSAEKYYRKAVALEPNNSYAIYGLGNCERGQGHIDEAIELWGKILANEPYNQNILSRLGDAWFSKDDLGRARYYYDESLAIDFDAFALIGLARLFRAEGEFVEAEACCNRVLMEKPGFERAIEELSLVLIDRDHANK